MGLGMARMDWLGKDILKLVEICDNLGVKYHSTETQNLKCKLYN